MRYRTAVVVTGMARRALKSGNFLGQLIKYSTDARIPTHEETGSSVHRRQLAADFCQLVRAIEATLSLLTAFASFTPAPLGHNAIMSVVNSAPHKEGLAASHIPSATRNDKAQSVSFDRRLIHP
jgi:hypothetical protein